MGPATTRVNNTNKVRLGTTVVPTNVRVMMLPVVDTAATTSTMISVLLFIRKGITLK